MNANQASAPTSTDASAPSPRDSDSANEFDLIIRADRAILPEGESAVQVGVSGGTIDPY